MDSLVFPLRNNTHYTGRPQSLHYDIYLKVRLYAREIGCYSPSTPSKWYLKTLPFCFQGKTKEFNSTIPCPRIVWWLQLWSEGFASDKNLCSTSLAWSKQTQNLTLGFYSRQQKSSNELNLNPPFLQTTGILLSKQHHVGGGGWVISSRQ